MQKNTCVVLLVLIVLNAVAAGPAHQFEWPKSVEDNSGTINLYRQFFEYTIAVMNQGIPALGVAPLDPLQLNVTLTFEGEPEATRGKLNSYPNMTIQVFGLTVSGFSNIVVDNATLDLEKMNSLLIVHNDQVDIVSYDVRVYAIDYEGQPRYCNCSKMSGFVAANTFDGHQQLSLNGTILQVDELVLDFESFETSVGVFFADCSGDIEVLQEVVDTLDDALSELAFEQIPECLNTVADEWKIILNDIFALRNVTESETSSRDAPKQLPRGEDFSSSDKDGRKMANRRSMSRASYEKNAPRRLEHAPIRIKYNF